MINYIFEKIAVGALIATLYCVQRIKHRLVRAVLSGMTMARTGTDVLSVVLCRCAFNQWTIKNSHDVMWWWWLLDEKRLFSN
jgi:hypothetical protein